MHMESAHPETTKRAIPYGLGLRVKRICSHDSGYQQHRADIKRHLKSRGYNEKFVESELCKVDQRDRESLLHHTNKKKQSGRVPLVLTYSKGLPNIRKIIRKHIGTLYTSDRMRKIFAQPPIVAYRRDSNLQDILVHKKHNHQFFKTQNGCRTCGAKKCAICPYVLEATTFIDPQGNSFNVRNEVNCKSNNVVYAVHCLRCRKFIYVGETGDTLYQRHLLNLSRIRNKYPFR